MLMNSSSDEAAKPASRNVPPATLAEVLGVSFSRRGGDEPPKKESSQGDGALDEPSEYGLSDILAEAAGSHIPFRGHLKSGQTIRRGGNIR